MSFSKAQRLPVCPIKAIRHAGEQYYVSDYPSGEQRGDRSIRLPSVSTILNATRSPEQRQALAQWRQRVGSEEANRISGSASRRGTGTHKQVSRYLQGEAVVCSEAIRPYWESLKPVLQAIEQVRLVEAPVLHAELGYAGKVDCIASYDGIPCLCEWKTADRPKHSLERLNDYPLQVAAYWGAVNRFYQADGVDLQHALLAIAIPDQPAEVFWLDEEAIAPYWEQWQERVAMFWRRQGGYGRWE